MAPVRRALEVMLENHSPYPAAVLDAHWNLLLANPAQQALIQAVVAEGGPLPQTGNMVELVFHPEGFRPFIANWETVAGFLLPHCPFFAPRELFDYYLEQADVPQPTAEELERQPAIIKKIKKLQGIDEPLTEHQIRVARAA